ncbi:MAG: type II secretion system GspH family protein [Patescibacteria group bacterium]|nr:type II secretion system GspH family protein [Patescibacteria group bacterium]
MKTKFNNSTRQPARQAIQQFNNSGFTLIELLVVVVMLSALVTMLIITINPIKQLQKAKDARRQHDLLQIRNALDSYFNDLNCYPATLTIGGQFNKGATVYMQKTPQDPDYANGSASYAYEVDNTSSCSQWNVLYAKLSNSQNLQVSCSLSQMKDSNGNACVPTNYQALGYNYCVLSGKVNCDFISSNPLPSPVLPSSTPTPTPTPTPTSTSAPTPTSTPTSTPTPTATPTPTPPPFNCSPNYFAVSVGLCNSVTSNQCTIYGGSLTCYSGPGATVCSGNLCTQ